jgi:DNA-binding ferritin-like protein
MMGIGIPPMKHKSDKHMKTKQIWMIAAISGLSFFAVSCGEKKEKMAESISEKASEMSEKASSMGEKASAAASSVGAAVSSAAGSLTLEGAAEKMADLLTQNIDAMSSIKDEESLKAAEAKLDQITEQLTANMEAIKKLPKPDEATRKMLSDKMKSGMEAKMEAKVKMMQENMMKLATEKPELMTKITEMQMKFAQKMEAVSKDMNEYF